MKRTYVYPYKTGSQSAASLARALGIQRIRHEGSRFRGGNQKTIINWGATEVPMEVGKCNILNTPEAVLTCSNKLDFFKAVDGKCSIPEYTEDKAVAEGWLEGNGIAFCRTLLRGSAGRGIVEAELPEELVNAQLYTKYVRKRGEYRIHVMGGKPFLVQKKVLGQGVNAEDANFHVRNHDGGFIFQRNDVDPPQDVMDQALLAFNAIKDLTFGSVDVIYNEHRAKAYVLEINTASGLSGTTIDDYSNAFREYLG